MYQPHHSQPSPSEARYDPLYKYQPAEDDVSQLYQNEVDRRARASLARQRAPPDFRPVLLRWPFVTALIFLILGLTGLVLYAERSMPGSDSSATIERRSSAFDVGHVFKERDDRIGEPDARWNFFFVLVERQDENAADPIISGRPPSEAPAPPSPSPETETEERDSNENPDPEVDTKSDPDNNKGGDENNNNRRPGPIDAEIAIVTDTITSKFTSVVTKPGPTTVVTTDRTTTLQTTIQSPIVTTVTSTTFDTLTETLTSKSVRIDDQGSTTLTVTEDVTEVVTKTEPRVLPPVEKTILTEFKSDIPTVIPFTETREGPPATYISVGTTTIISVYTIRGEEQAPITNIRTSDIPGTVLTLVETPEPTTFVSTGWDGVELTFTVTPEPTTRVSTVPPTRTVITSVSTPSSSSSGDRVVVEASAYTLTPAAYFIGKFLPPLLAVLLALTLRALDQSAKLYHPFAALASPGGCSGRDGLSVHFDGWGGLYRPFEILAEGHAAPFLTTLAVWGSSLLPSLSAEALGLKIHGRCRAGAIDGCALGLGVSENAARALVGLLGCFVVILVALLFVLARGWKTGVPANPWCIAGAGALARNHDVVGPLRDREFAAAKAALAERRFTMGWFRNSSGRDEYGIVLCDEAGRSLHYADPAEQYAQHQHQQNYVPAGVYPLQASPVMRRRGASTFIALTLAWRIAFLFYLLCLTAVILYHHISSRLPENLKRFMDSQTFGVRFISAALGVIVILCWECLFTSIAIVSPYRCMARRPQIASTSVLISRPTNAISGLGTAVQARDPLLFGAALAAVLAEFLPILLVNVPYNLTQTRETHDICARLAAGLLGIMAIAVAGSLFVRWPDMPVDPRSITGAMWYVTESRWVSGLEGVAGMKADERKMKVRQAGSRWSYGVIFGGHRERLGVEAEDAYGTEYRIGYTSP